MSYLYTNKEIVDKKISLWKSAANLKFWEKRIDHIKDEHIRLCTAILLENQRLFNEQFNYTVEVSENLYQIILNVIPNLIIHQLVSVQPMLGPAGVFICNEGIKRVKDEEGNDVFDIQQIEQVDGTIKEFSYPQLNIPLYQKDIGSKTRKIASAIGSVDEFSKILKEIIEKEILNDLWNNVGTTSSQTNDVNENWYESGYSRYLPAVCNTIRRKTLIYSKFFLVMNSNTYNNHKQNIDWNMRFHYDQLHIIDHWDKDGILVGAFNDEFWQREYVWAPYILLSIAEDKILMRYSKALGKEGSKAYGKLVEKENAV